MFDFKFDWQPEMDTHIQDMDVQHRQLFKIGRDMEQLLRIKCIGVTDAQLLDIVLQLRDFTGYHFYEEEMLMQEMQYAKLKEHRQMHLKYANYVMNINMPQLKADPEKKLKEIKDEIQEWIFTHMLHDDQEFARAYLAWKSGREAEKNEASAELPELVYVEGFGYEICSLEVSRVYLDKNQSQKGHVVVAYKENARDFGHLTALERNIYFGELSKVTNALLKLYDAKIADYVSIGMTDRNFSFHILPRYASDDGIEGGCLAPADESELTDLELAVRIDEIKKALNK